MSEVTTRIPRSPRKLLEKLRLVLSDYRERSADYRAEYELESTIRIDCAIEALKAVVQMTSDKD